MLPPPDAERMVGAGGDRPPTDTGRIYRVQGFNSIARARASVAPMFSTVCVVFSRHRTSPALLGATRLFPSGSRLRIVASGGFSPGGPSSTGGIHQPITSRMASLEQNNEADSRQ